MGGERLNQSWRPSEVVRFTGHSGSWEMKGWIGHDDHLKWSNLLVTVDHGRWKVESVMMTISSGQIYWSQWLMQDEMLN